MNTTRISKAEFARRKKRSRACVSKWIRLGKLSPAALLEDGTIWLERAEADLAASLDPSQQTSQAAPILPSSPPAHAGLENPSAAEGCSSSAAQSRMPRASMTEREIDLARRAKADADRAELDAETARRRLAIDEGRYVVAEDAARAWSRELSRFISDSETFITSTLARQIAEEHGLDWKAVAVLFREGWRQFRANVSKEAGERRAEVESEQQLKN